MSRHQSTCCGRRPDCAAPGRAAALLAVALLAASGAVAQGAAGAAGTPVPTRGQLLYGNHCIACHDTQVHWRNQKLAKDWRSLRQLVLQWQARERLGWSDADIADVTRHLNDSIYRFAAPGERLGAAGARTRPPAGAMPG